MSDPPAGEEGWADMRASDADRDRVAALLREHCAAGRLSFEELSERLDQALSSRTLGELYSLTGDLPHLAGPHPVIASQGPPAPTPRRSGLARHRRAGSLAVEALGAAVVWAFLVGVWAASGGGSFWPIWPLLGMAVFLGVRVVRELGEGHDRGG
jgi:hypothetical protein